MNREPENRDVCLIFWKDPDSRMTVLHFSSKIASPRCLLRYLQISRVYTVSYSICKDREFRVHVTFFPQIVSSVVSFSRFWVFAKFLFKLLVAFLWVNLIIASWCTLSKLAKIANLESLLILRKNRDSIVSLQLFKNASL